MSKRWPGLGIPPGMIEPGLVVMVAVGTVAAETSKTSTVICYATVAESVDALPDTWWLNVHVGAGTVLPQMWRAEEILGIPPSGLTPAEAKAFVDKQQTTGDHH